MNMASVSKRRWKHNGVDKEAWIVRYKDGRGSYRQKTFDKKKDADRFRTKVETEIENGTHIPPADSRTVAAAASQFLEEIDHKVAIGALRPSTGKNYHNAFSNAILPSLGSKLLIDVQPVDVQRWYRDIIREVGMHPRTAHRRLWFLKAMFAFAIRRKWARDNPVPDAAEALGRPKEAKIEVFAIEDVRAIISTANERPYRAHDRAFQMARLAVNLAAFCGLRWGEIFGLTLAHVDLQRQTIRIAHTIDGLGNLQEPKTAAGNRVVPLPDHIATQLAEWLATYPTVSKRGLVFATKNGQNMWAGNFREQQWLPLLRRAGIEDRDGKNVHFHALRHFAVSWMIENNWPITDVAAIVGHANVSITLKTYAHVVKGRQQSAEAMQGLAQRLLSGPSVTQIPAASVARLTHEAISH